MLEVATGSGAAVVLVGFLVRWLTRLVENHMTHNTAALVELRLAIQELTTEIRAQRK